MKQGKKQSMLVTSNEVKFIRRLRQLQNQQRSTIVAIELSNGDYKGWYVTGKREQGSDCIHFIHRLKQLLTEQQSKLVVLEVNNGNCKGWHVTGNLEGEETETVG